MAQQPRLVNKQFNSPIGLYSEHNIKEILDRETQMLANGAVGINFQNPSTTKPASLHNSAVLRMLEEEEGRQRSGQNAGFRSDGKPLQAAWPPPGLNNRQRRFTDVVISGVKRVAWPPPPSEGEENESQLQQEPLQAQGGPQYSTLNGAPQQYRTLPTQKSPVFQQNRSPLSSPVPYPSPQQQQQQQQQQQFTSNQALNQPQSTLVRNLPSPQPFSPQPHQQQQQQWSPVQVENQAFSAPQPAAVRHFEPPPTTITLRPSVPITQAPAPVFFSQPATATFRGGKNLRGDLKWPPEDVRERMEAENRQRMELARGPACRPRKVAKDYSPFFAQNALNSSYPGYKVPPGTQFYDHHPVW